MGRDKATLPFGPELMLQRVVRLLSQVVERQKIVIVAAPDQQLPPLPTDIAVARDRCPGRGPLEGLSAGLNALLGKVDAVYATSCDVPLLVPAFVTLMFELLDDYDIAVPCEADQYHPLAAVYRLTVLKDVQELLSGDQLRPRFLFDRVKTRSVSIDDLRNIDPELQTLLNLNHPDDYQSALAAAGFSDDRPGNN
jgi:molybdopterin-guanine dinucleotide biosynthesis protein A